MRVFEIELNGVGGGEYREQGANRGSGPSPVTTFTGIPLTKWVPFTSFDDLPDGVAERLRLKIGTNPDDAYVIIEVND